MQVIEKHQWTQIAGGKVASGGRLGAPPKSAPVTASASVSGFSNTTTTVNVTCSGKVETETLLWGAWQKTVCEPAPASKPAPTPNKGGSKGPSSSGTSIGITDLQRRVHGIELIPIG